jgi:hypothetical protein
LSVALKITDKIWKGFIFKNSNSTCGSTYKILNYIDEKIHN